MSKASKKQCLHYIICPSDGTDKFFLKLQNIVYLCLKIIIKAGRAHNINLLRDNNPSDVSFL